MLQLIQNPAICRKGVLCVFVFGMVALTTACQKDQVEPRVQAIQADTVKIRIAVDEQPPKDADGGPGGRKLSSSAETDSTQAAPNAQPPKDADGGPGH